MALRSMTGFGSATGLAGDVDLCVEVRSVNHKGLDVKVSLPSSIALHEPRIIGLARQQLERGRVNVKVSFDASKTHGTRLVLDVEAAQSMASQLERLRSTLCIEAPVTLDHVLSFPNLVLRDPSATPGLEPEALWSCLEPIVDAAVRGLVSERDREGEQLSLDMLERLEKIAGCVGLIEVELPSCQKHFLDRLKERVSEVVRQFEIEDISEERLLQEVIIFADRSDIAEEITRARAHISALTALIKENDPKQGEPVGKKLDFYFQELIRETNTMGSKSQSGVIARCVVEMRSEIDRLREQVLNVA